MVTFYGYDRCSTCTKAKRALSELGIAFESVDITTNPPDASLLRALLAGGDYKLTDLFNKSGQRYRELGMRDKLKGMSEKEALALLAKEGKLCKRPIVTDGKRHTVGFRPEVFERVWG